MTLQIEGLELLCTDVLRRHVEGGDESTLNEAYEFGRRALASGIGVLELTQMLWRSAVAVRRSGVGEDGAFAEACESFLLESLSPFEMAFRGAREANEALRQLDARREEDVRRIARELHDEAGQRLAVVHLALAGVQPHLGAEGAEPLARAFDLLRGAEQEIRRLTHELRPLAIDDLGLLAALHHLGEGVSRRGQLEVVVSGPDEPRLPANIEIVLYRAVQEALTNVVRHARATRVEVEVWFGAREVWCEVRDDGRGFEPGLISAAQSRGLGLHGIRERIAPLGGALEIVSKPGDGAALSIRIPLEIRHARASAAGG